MKNRNKKEKSDKLTTNFRFNSQEAKDVIVKAAKETQRSINGFMLYSALKESIRIKQEKERSMK